MKILVLDNYDSFTYNLVQYVEKCGENIDVEVRFNDCITLNEIGKYDKIILSPGPGLPEESGILMQIIHQYASSKPIFGVCLGQQAMAEVFGGKLKNLDTVFHGVSTLMKVTDPTEILFSNIPATFKAGRYHSWVVDEKELPDCFRIICKDEYNHIMGLRHKEFNLVGVQFHPESVLTEHGEQLIKNWIYLS
ncbi:MAG: anthranilate synthase component II [Flavobacteriales bacterium]